MKRYKAIFVAAALAAAALLPAGGALAQAERERDAADAFGALMREMEQKKASLPMEELVGFAEKRLTEFVREYPGTKAAGTAMVTLGQIYLDMDRYDEAEAVLKKVIAEKGGAEERALMGARMMLERIPVLRRLIVGEKAIDFNSVDTRGEKVSLGQYRGKIVLLDFWATWCGPCRAEMPNVKKVYGQYHPMGFEILGVSLDESRERFEAYIKEQNISWRQIFDGKGWQAEVGRKFAVASIPATFLIDREGIIRYKNLRGADLEAAVRELIEKK